MQTNLEALRALIEPDRVHRAIYVEPAIFDLEMERIFGRAWVLVGHESQTPNPGDYFTTIIGKQPVVMVRHTDGSIRVLYNRCGHRGAKVVGDRAGNARFFRCCYHGWTFRTDGQVLSVPLRRGYNDTNFNPQDPQFWMTPAAQVDSYRGFVFASLAPEGPDLRSFLGGVASSLDDFVDRSPQGRIEVAGRPFRVLQRNNWKLFFENLNDAMHALVVHESSVEAARSEAAREAARPESNGQGSYAAELIPTLDKNGIPYAAWEKLETTAFEWGHSFLGGFFNPESYERSYVEAMEKAHGTERMREILSVNRHNTIIYPSCSTQSAYQQLRVIRPLAVDRTMVEIYNFRLAGAPPDTYRRTMIFTNLTNSPSSIVMPDDLEAYHRVQEGLGSNGSDWISLHRDYGRDSAHAGSVTANATSELPMRNQTRVWLKYMTGEAPA
ncbi:MAG: Rieske 2Fe-2S domain-containing protein [Candidatus Binataceae bacterium]|nr:Rieske 2Fe-2S domain-containing protein [Candidatus Binataceae bacterium]